MFPFRDQPASGRRDRLQLPAHPGDLLVLAGAGGEPAVDLSEHIRGRSLAGRYLLTLAALDADLPGAGRVRDQHAGRGAGGRLNSQTLLGAVTLAAVLLAGSHWFWGVGLRHYSGARHCSAVGLTVGYAMLGRSSLSTTRIRSLQVRCIPARAPDPYCQGGSELSVALDRRSI